MYDIDHDALHAFNTRRGMQTWDGSRLRRRAHSRQTRGVHSDRQGKSTAIDEGRAVKNESSAVTNEGHAVATRDGMDVGGEKTLVVKKLRKGTVGVRHVHMPRSTVITLSIESRIACSCVVSRNS